METKMIAPDGIITKLPELETFNQCWRFFKTRFDEPMVEVTNVRIDGDTYIALIDEDGISKRLPYNPVASAYAEVAHAYHSSGLANRRPALLGHVLVCATSATKDYFTNDGE